MSDQPTEYVPGSVPAQEPEPEPEPEPNPPYRQIRATYDAETITVYQAYEPGIALEAIRLNRFAPSYNRNRMTWIKPSFLWMMYRCGWATKPQQEHVLAIRLRRDGFETALRQATLSHYDPAVHPSHAQWSAHATKSPVRIQWDPERDVHFRPLGHRAIQIGISGTAVDDYCDTWITGIDDATDLTHRIHALIRDHRYPEAHALLPAERPYPLPADLAALIGASAPNGTNGTSQANR
ncbi:MAG TPA: DUF4291 domain-containing protein [Actinocrinis sp.]|nr:DUF4291 domain-containing protein [Actinocrinis sp.]